MLASYLRPMLRRCHAPAAAAAAQVTYDGTRRALACVVFRRWGPATARRELSSFAHGGLLGDAGQQVSGLGSDSDNLLQQLGSRTIVGDATTAQSLLTQLEHLEAAGEVYRAADFTLMLEACRAAGLWEAAVDLVHSILDPDASHFLVAIEACGRAGEVDAAMELVQSMRQLGAAPDAAVLTQLVLACGRAQPTRPREAAAVLHEMREMGAVPGLAALGGAFAVHAGAGEWASAESALRALAVAAEREGVGHVTGKGCEVSALAATAAGDAAPAWEEAVEALERMAAKGVPPSVVSYRPALLACAEHGQWGTVVKLWRTAATSQVKLDEPSFHAVLEACAHEGAWEDAVSVLRDMKQQRVPRSQRSHGLATLACEARGGEAWQAALDVMANAEAAGVGAGVLGRAGAARACAEGGQWTKALELVAALLERLPPALPRKAGAAPPSSEELGAALLACRRTGQWNSLLGLMDEMLRLGMLPDDKSIDAAIEACERLRDWRRTAQLYAGLLQCGATPGSGSSLALLQRICEKGAAAEPAQPAQPAEPTEPAMTAGAEAAEPAMTAPKSGQAKAQHATLTDEQVVALVQQRLAARYERRFPDADAIKARLEAAGIDTRDFSTEAQREGRNSLGENFSAWVSVPQSLLDKDIAVGYKTAWSRARPRKNKNRNRKRVQ